MNKVEWGISKYATTEEFEDLKKDMCRDQQSLVIGLDALGRKVNDMRSEINQLQRDVEVEKRKSHMLVWALATVTAFMLCGFASMAHAKDMIIGDSHVGGLKPYLQKYMDVRYKNGTTAAYWLRQPAKKVNTLFVMTGTNEQFNGTPPSKWLNQTRAICNKWNPNRCVIVAPPPNGRRNYMAYRSVLKSNSNIVSSYSVSWKVDKVHFTPNGYRQIAKQILEKR